MPKNAPKNILIAPLDWGAGHTTRCMPIVEHLLQMGQNVLVAGNEAQLAIVTEAFGKSISTLALEGYNIFYSPINKYAQAGLLLQMPRVLQTIKREHRWLQQAIKEHNIDGVISDNRYGLYNSAVPCVVMTHQLHILSGMGSTADNMVQRLHYRYLNRFSGTWIVDADGEDALAGKLSHTSPLPNNAKYIGLLSRFADDGVDYGNPQADVLLVLLSGPEPQRGILSAMLWQQVLQYAGRVIFAEGSEAANAPKEIPAHTQYHKRLGGQALKDALKQARLVVCRSGYSTLMDLAATGKNAILIPTPGQTEQEYLGKLMQEKGVHFTMPQDAFSLPQALKGAEKIAHLNKTNAGAFKLHRHIADEWIAEL